MREILARNAAKLTDVEKAARARLGDAAFRACPPDAIVMGDASQIVYTGCFAMPMELERCWYYSGTYCALGVALPMAIGAKIGAPHRPVIAVAGDGGIMFTVNELATAAEERLALPVIVWNNDALKEIVDQMDQRQIPRIGVEPKSPGLPAPGAEPRLPRRARHERRAPGAIRTQCAGRRSSDPDRSSAGQSVADGLGDGGIHAAGDSRSLRGLSPDAGRGDVAPGSGR